MIVISNNLVLSSLGDTIDNPLIGWKNLVTVGNTTATSELVDFPAANLANPSTFLKWKGDEISGVNFITFDIASIEQVDYIAVAGQNWGSAQIVVAVEGFIDGYWVNLVQEVILSDDSPALFRFTPQSLLAIRFVLDGGITFPEAAVVYCGKLLILPRRIYVGHPVIKFNRSATLINGRSESGQFLGRIVLGENNNTSIQQKNISPLIFREDIEPWLKAAVEIPFFFAWRPMSYPLEVGYCWSTNDSQMTNQLSNGLIEYQIALQGLV